jgi:hypothetical protein
MVQNTNYNFPAFGSTVKTQTLDYYLTAPFAAGNRLLRRSPLLVVYRFAVGVVPRENYAVRLHSSTLHYYHHTTVQLVHPANSKTEYVKRPALRCYG